MGFILETHLHTSQGSRCGKVRGRDYIDFMKSRGFSGMIVTDHFFTGNSAVPHDLPWRERVDIYMSGYEEALKAAQGSDFTVLFGIEFNFSGDEYLLYGPGRKWLLDNPDIESVSRRELHNRVRNAGGVMIQAHPYRERDYLSSINLCPQACDGIEIYNAANDDNMNALAYEYAVRLGVPATAGSDIHYFHDGALGGMLFESGVGTIGEFAASFSQAVPVKVFESDVTPVTAFPELTKHTKEPVLPVIGIEY